MALYYVFIVVVVVTLLLLSEQYCTIMMGRVKSYKKELFN